MCSLTSFDGYRMIFVIIFPNSFVYGLLIGLRSAPLSPKHKKLFMA